MAETSTPLIKKSSLYSRTGDDGSASLFSGDREPKTHPIFHALGTIDELNAQLSIIKFQFKTEGDTLTDIFDNQLEKIQNRLIRLGAHIATPKTASSTEKLEKTKFPTDATTELEKWIDYYDAQLPKLTTFIVPSGGLICAHFHLARAVCRRAERTITALNREDLDEVAFQFINRLSDYLFVSARYACQIRGEEETIYKKQ